MAKKKKFLSRWGWFIQQGADQRIRDTKFGGTYQWCPEPTKTSGKEHLVKFGNNFDATWRSHLQIKHDNWHFWDNPEMCHLLYPSSINEKGGKHWMRWIKGDILTTKSEFTNGTDRINKLLNKLNPKLNSWHDLIRELDPTFPNKIDLRSKTAWLVTSSEGCHQWYYNQPRKNWIIETTKELNKKGFKVIGVHTKPTRGQRTGNPNLRLYQKLQNTKPGLIVNQHSASTIEILLAGVPVICRGLHCGGPLVTNWKDFVAGHPPTIPTFSQVEEWMNTILSNTRHKAEVVSNDFYKNADITPTWPPSA